MDMFQLILSIIQVIGCLFLIGVVLLQSSKSAGLSGAISGASETFLSKNKARTWDAKLAKLTAIVAGVFIIVTLILAII